MSQGEDCAGKILFPEDTVLYRLYPTEGPDCDHGYLTELAVECSHRAKTLASGHIWHCDPFRLAAWPGGKDVHPPHIFGRTCYQDNVEDEWLIVYLLFELSRVYPQLVATLIDTDGQFLLIEAAHQLPRWLKPETSENRVFIHHGELHIVPKPCTPADVTRLPVATPTIHEAIRLVKDPDVPTVADTSIQTVLQKRISKFPGCLQTFLHQAHCYLPCPVAHVLSHDRQLIAAAVHALCDRDPDDMRACQRMEHFSPLRHSSVMAEVTFTRCLYAKLLHQAFSPPRHSGLKLPPYGAPGFKAYDLGLKLTCGLEILLAKVGGVGGRSKEVADDPRWTPFIQGLKDRTYFQNELEGSRLYQQLLQTAKDYFASSVLGGEGEKGEGERRVVWGDPLTSAGKRVAKILHTVPYSEEEVMMRWQNLGTEDDDSWIEISPEELDQMMYRASGNAPPTTKPHPSTEADLESLVFGMTSFVEKASSHHGAEFPWATDDKSEIQFDPDSFMDTVRSMLAGRERESGSSEEEELSGSEQEDEDMATVMHQMDRELAQTEVGRSFSKVAPGPSTTNQPVAEDEQLAPVDVDFNLVKNLLESYSSQQGLAGPASNILHSMGVHIPDKEEEMEGAGKATARDH